MKEKTQKNNKKQIKYTLNKVFTIFFVVFFVVTLLSTIYFATMRSQGKPVRFFGYSICYVLTDSMEDTLMVGDVIIIKHIPENQIKTGDIVTYKSTQGPLAGNYITHRIVQIKQNGGSLQFVTKGDAPGSYVDSEYVNYQKVLGIYQNKAVVVGFILSMLSKFYVFFLLIILPLLVLFALQIKTFVVALNEPEETAEITAEVERTEKVAETTEKENKTETIKSKPTKTAKQPESQKAQPSKKTKKDQHKTLK